MSDTPTTAPEPAPIKRSRKRAVLITVLVVLILALALPLTNLLTPRPTGTILTLQAAGDPERLQAVTVLERNCLDCHSSEAKTPFYAAFPIAGPLIAQDRTQGLRYIDMTEELATPASQPAAEGAIAALEYVIDRNTMPPTRYILMHWNRHLNAAEKGLVLDWVRGVRKAHYATRGVSEQFATDALQPLPTSLPVEPRKAALGKKLFNDPRLSADDTLTCASCHALDKGGTDQRATSIGIRGQTGPINSPTVYNAVFNIRQFWDGRAADLPEQAAGPVTNPIEMGSNFEQVIGKLAKDAAFTTEFTAVYPSGLTQANITDAIAEFERTLITPNSRFDQYLKGQTGVLTAGELEGLDLFRANGCAVCHVGKDLGGQSFERLGRRADYFADRGALTEADDGRFSVTRKERDRFAFKVPTLRNIALTFPYFHDATQATLDQAVRTMAKYQGYRQFRDEEIEKVVGFLRTLTGQHDGRPL